MDYSPPKDMTNYTPTHTTSDNLRLRDSANTNSKIVSTLLKNTDVQLLETGFLAAIIDGITAPWVKVLSNTGYTGWCFSGYLEPVALPNENKMPDATEITEQTIEADKPIVPENKKPFPLWWMLIGAGGVVIVASVLVVIALRRRKNSSGNGS
jgi:hypothetical protein